jgi:hypothetical protein
MITRVCNIVYPEIISFMKDINFVLCDTFSVPEIDIEDYSKAISLANTLKDEKVFELPVITISA